MDTGAADIGRQLVRSRRRLIALPPGERGCARSEDGVAIIELALVLLPLCLIVFGAVDLGRAFIFIDQLRNAAQAGAFYGRNFPTWVNPDSTTCADPDNIQYQAANEFTGNGPTGSSSFPSGYVFKVTDETTGATLSGCGPDEIPAVVVSSVSSCPSPRTSTSVCSGDLLQVRVSAPFHLITPIIGAITGNTLTLTGTSEVVIP